MNPIAPSALLMTTSAFGAGELSGRRTVPWTAPVAVARYTFNVTASPSFTILPAATPANPFCCVPTAVTTKAPALKASPPLNRATPRSSPVWPANSVIWRFG